MLAGIPTETAVLVKQPMGPGVVQPVVIVIVCHAIATDGGVGGVLDHGLCLDRSVALTLRD